MRVTAIVLAAGKGERLGLGFNKIFAKLLDKPVLVYSLELFEACADIEQIIVVAAAAEQEQIRSLVAEYGITKAKTIVPGGDSRARSVACALPYISCCSDLVLVHDGARPLLKSADLQAVLAAVEHSEGAILAVPVTDTIKQVSAGCIVGTLQRSTLWAAQTPQVFPVEAFLDAYAGLDNSVTDDASLMEACGAKIRVVAGSTDNLKITNPLDLALAELLLKQRQEA